MGISGTFFLKRNSDYFCSNGKNIFLFEEIGCDVCVCREESTEKKMYFCLNGKNVFLCVLFL